jgi:hypothetical protein
VRTWVRSSGITCIAPLARSHVSPNLSVCNLLVVCHERQVVLGHGRSAPEASLHQRDVAGWLGEVPGMLRWH